MEGPTKLAGLPIAPQSNSVANYSYPRHDDGPLRYQNHGSPKDRSSVGSEGSSPPGLIDDRTDSEASGDDDYQYHTHTTELWDTFWKPGHNERKRTHPGKSSRNHYPALIPSPQAPRQRPRGPRPQPRQAWPLPDRPDRQPEQNLKRTPTYSPFPKTAVFPPRTCSKAPCRPPRSPCCENGFLAPLVQQLPRLTVPRSSSTHSSLKSPLYTNSLPSPRIMSHSPHSQMTCPQPATSHCTRTPSPINPRLPMPPESSAPLTFSGASRSAIHLPLQGQHPHNLRPYKSNNQLYNDKPLPEPQPHSVFEYDSDSDTAPNDDISATLAFFRFHRKGENRSAVKSAHQSMEAANAAQRRRQRRRRESSMANPPTPPRKQKQKEQQLPHVPSIGSNPCPKHRQSDVISRMLGRRSR